jgi:predicted double-glycine peptidase
METRRSPEQKITTGGWVLFFCLAWPALPAAEAASLRVGFGGMVITKEVKTVRDLRYEKVISQTTDYSCGAASLATILTHYFGRETTEKEILDAVLQGPEEEVQRIKKKGLSLLDLKKFAESLGFEGKGYRLKVSELSRLDRPAIVLIDAKGYNHFVVLKGIVDENVHLADPIRGNRVMGLDEFAGIWNGILLAFKKTNGETVDSNALYAKQVLPDDKIRLFPRPTDVATFATSPTDF